MTAPADCLREGFVQVRCGIEPRCRRHVRRVCDQNGSGRPTAQSDQSGRYRRIRWQMYIQRENRGRGCAHLKMQLRHLNDRNASTRLHKKNISQRYAVCIHCCSRGLNSYRITKSQCLTKCLPCAWVTRAVVTMVATSAATT